MSFILANKITLHYAWDGPKSRIPLVFVNSLGTNLHMWDALIPYMSPQTPLLRYDTRGHGLSDAPSAPYTIRDHSGDLSALLDELGVETCIVVGLSVGGLVAIDFALQHPQRLCALVLCDTAPRIGTRESWSERMSFVQEQGLPNIAEMIVQRWFTSDFAGRQPANFRGYVNMLARTPPEGYLGTCAALRDTDLSDVVNRIALPCLVLCGAQDVATSPEMVRAVAEVLPDARFELIEAAAHLPCVEQPQAVAAAIERFLEEKVHAR